LYGAFVWARRALNRQKRRFLGRAVIEECVNATKSGVVDGCFCDRAVDGTPSDSGDDMVPCGSPPGKGKKLKPCGHNLTATKAAAYAAGHVQVLTDLQTAIGEGPV
jgi:hypothetical protein